MKSIIYIVLLFVICPLVSLQAQQLPTDSITVDSAVLLLDTIPTDEKNPLLQDSLQGPQTTNLDSILNASSESSAPQITNPQIDISPDRPDQPIDFGSKDSSYLDMSKNQIHLFGEAFVKYGKYNLDAGYIIFDFDDNEASAFDTLPGGEKLKNASFTDGSNAFTATGLRYNFKSNKGLIYNAVTSEGEFQVLGSKTKFVSKDADSTSTADQIYNKNAVITTCTNPIPHYGIRSRKLKVVPNRLAVAGFSQLELAGIPTPVVLPFGFYPLVDGLSSGLIFPADFDVNPQLGIGMRGVGYYFPISDYIDLTVTGDIYTRGTHRITVLSNFKKRYKYSGSVTLRYANNIVENPADLTRVSNKGFGIKVSRTQDSKAHPYRTISGSIDISTGDFYSTNFNDFNNATKQQYSSSFNYRNTLPGTPFTVNVGLAHNQNTRTGTMNITLPDAKLTMQTIYPFKSKIPSTTEKWYEKINVGGSSAFKAFVSTADSTLFTKQTLDDLQTGMYNTATVRASFKLLKYLNIEPSVKTDQYLFAKTLEKNELAPAIDTLRIEYDQDSMPTVFFDTTYAVMDDFVAGFDALHNVNMGFSVNTQIFGTKTWSKGWLRGIRHTMRPNVSFNYSPSTLDRLRVDTLENNPDVLADDETISYNPFAGGIYSANPRGESKSINFSLVNNFEGKYYSKKDSTEKKFKLFREVRITTGYNFAADSIKWSPLAISFGNTKLTKFTSLQANAFYNFYVKKDGRLIDQTIWSQSESKRPFEFDRLTVTLSTNFTFKDIFNIFTKKESKEGNSGDNVSNESRDRGAKGAPTTLMGTIDNFKVGHRFVFNYENQEVGSDTLKVTSHVLTLQGKVQLTPKWSVSVQNIQYNIKASKFEYPAFTISRDLHCWNMNISWYPSSSVYNFFIGVKSSNLSFLKYNYGGQNFNNLGFGR